MKGKKVLYYWGDDNLRPGRLYGFYTMSEMVYTNGVPFVTHSVVGVIEDAETLEFRRVEPELIKAIANENNDRY
jgi:hypothetical protein